MMQAPISPCPAPATPLDAAALRLDFPLVRRGINGYPLAYLDSAATAQKPRQVLEAMESYYRTANANVHRGVYTLAEEATALYEGARERVAALVNAPSPQQIIFTRNATEAINLVALSWGRSTLRALGLDRIAAHEQTIVADTLTRLAADSAVTVYGLPDAGDHGGVISFNVGDVHPHDVAAILDSSGVAIRAGHHCAQPLMDRLGVAATSRASVALYTTTEDLLGELGISLSPMRLKCALLALKPLKAALYGLGQ